MSNKHSILEDIVTAFAEPLKFVGSTKPWLATFLLGFSSLSISCGKSVSAQPHQGFTPTSAIVPMDKNTWYIGVEALFNQTGMSEARMQFQLPPDRVVASLQGTLAYKSNCYAEALASFVVDGKQYPMIIKSRPAGGNVNIFIHYDVPLEYAQGNAELVLSNGQVCDTSMDARDRTTWEFQGLLALRKPN